MGYLKEQSGIPVASRSFKVRRKGSKEEPHLAFTNAAGRFQLPPLQPGDYEIILEEGRLPGTLIIPKGSKGIYQISSILLPE
jgi:hypothetical protein